MMTYVAFGLILLILAQPYAILRVVRSGEIAMKGTRFSRRNEPRRFWTTIGIVIAWLIATDLFLIAQLYFAVR